MSESISSIEQKLIRGCQKKQLKAQEMLYKHFFGYAMSICLRYAYSREEAGEILNDGFMKVFDKIETYQEGNSFKAWLRKILINTAIDYQRKNLKYQQTTQLEELVHTEGYNSVIEKLSVEDILSLLNQLSHLQRCVFNLFEIEGYSHSEIAEILEIPENTSRTYLTRAKKKLRELFEDLYTEKDYERKL